VAAARWPIKLWVLPQSLISLTARAVKLIMVRVLSFLLSPFATALSQYIRTRKRGPLLTAELLDAGWCPFGRFCRSLFGAGSKKLHMQRARSQRLAADMTTEMWSRLSSFKYIMGNHVAALSEHEGALECRHTRFIV
jgi:hypothetical protein